jgi:cellulose synthase/poly-beta-1,6-N-acetylglucosamine synthase-like glycosyltransferase
MSGSTELTNENESFEVEFPRQPRAFERYSYDEEAPSSSLGDEQPRTSPRKGIYEGGPVDLDLFFSSDNRLNIEDDDDNGSLFDDDFKNGVDLSETETLLGGTVGEPRFFNNPERRLLDNDASLIPGSPFSKPANKISNRPTEPLAIAKYASTFAFFVTFGWVAFLFFMAIWNYNSVGRIIVEVILALLSFFGLFWNSYFIVASIFKCFIPAQAFKKNTKYCSIIPEPKPAEADWLEVTIQIPVYKESLREVLAPTLRSCIAARDYYAKKSKARCNIVVCDDGMMALLRDNFPAAEMLWNSIHETQGQTVRLSKLLKHVPRASRRHLKGLRSRNVYEVFHRMLFYYHYKIGFVARSTIDRRGKFKKASNLNSHLRLALGAAQLAESTDNSLSFNEALLRESHNEDGSRYVMFGNDIKLGHLICVNDADARMAESVILKTVPEFLDDKSLGFTQHATKTMNEQRGESYFTNLLAVYTDALYQGHFLLSSILGCHPPLVGHSIFLRTEAVNQCGRMRTIRKAQQWLKNIGVPFLPVDQIGFANLQAQNRIEYWSENHVSEDFELMIHLYNLGFNGRYCAFPDCEFQEGITRTFDEEAGRHRKFSLGGHELVFNPFTDMLGHGIFTPLFRTFIQCDIPSYFKIFLTAYLCSYMSGGVYLIVFSASAIARLIDSESSVETLYAFSPAGVIILNFIIYYVLGYITFLISLLRMYYNNNKLLFAEYRKKMGGACYLVFVELRYCLVFQFLFYNVATFTFYFLGSMDHMLSRPGIVGATNKDSINIGRCTAFWDMARFNSGSWLLAVIMLVLAYATVVQDYDWDIMSYPDNKDDILQHALFAGPAVFLAIMAFVVPIILNPWILGWPFLRQPKKKPVEKKKKTVKKDALGRKIVGLSTFIDATNELDDEMERAQKKPDVELGSLATRELRSAGSPSTGQEGQRKSLDRVLGQNKKGASSRQEEHKRIRQQNLERMRAIPEDGRRSRDASLERRPPGNQPQQQRKSRASSGKAGRSSQGYRGGL